MLTWASPPLCSLTRVDKIREISRMKHLLQVTEAGGLNCRQITQLLFYNVNHKGISCTKLKPTMYSFPFHSKSCDCSAAALCKLIFHHDLCLCTLRPLTHPVKELCLGLTVPLCPPQMVLSSLRSWRKWPKTTRTTQTSALSGSTPMTSLWYELSYWIS